MSAFAIILHDEESSPRLRKLIEEGYPGSEHFKFPDSVYFVTGPRLVTEVTASLGFDDDADLYAARLRLNGSFSGRSWIRLWDWLKAAEVLMIVARADGRRGEPDPFSRADYQGLEGRIIRLEEFRHAHDKEHSDHVATHAWVYKRGYVVAGLVATVAASVGAALGQQ